MVWFGRLWYWFGHILDQLPLGLWRSHVKLHIPIMNIGTWWDNKTKILYSREICYCYYVICYYSNDWSTEKKYKIHMVNLSSLIHSKSWVKNIAWVFGIIRCNVLVDILVKCQSRYQLLIYWTSVSRRSMCWPGIARAWVEYDRLTYRPIISQLSVDSPKSG